jgi:hypothetical protein
MSRWGSAGNENGLAPSCIRLVIGLHLYRLKKAYAVLSSQADLRVYSSCFGQGMLVLGSRRVPLGADTRIV